MSSIFPLIKANIFEPVWSVVTFESIINVHWEGWKVAGMEGSKKMILNFSEPGNT
jgi:hypothetical protein